MARLTNKQKRELAVIRWFVPEMYSDTLIVDEDIATFFAWSDKGIGKIQIERGAKAYGLKTGLNALYWGKQRRDLQVTSWLEDWGNTINAWSFTEEPEEVVKWIAERLDKPAILVEYYRTRKNHYQRLERRQSQVVSNLIATRMAQFS